MSNATRKAKEQADRNRRAHIIAALGWEPEDGTFAGSYACRTGELENWLNDRKVAQ